MAARTSKSSLGPIDRLMERASVALEAMRYFEAEKVALTALRRAHKAGDFERMARIILPLQEARRQKRQLAVDSGLRCIMGTMAALRGAAMPGCYLFQPPLIAMDARAFRESADAGQVPVFVLAREPMSRDGLWPVAAVNGVASIRVKVRPPRPLERVESSVTRDDFAGDAPDAPWFEAAAEALGDAAIGRLRADDPASWRVDDLVELLDCHPDHEKLHQRLADECRMAMTEPPPEGRRHRPWLDDPMAF